VRQAERSPERNKRQIKDIIKINRDIKRKNTKYKIIKKFKINMNNYLAKFS
jgi:hypothetical protein